MKQTDQNLKILFCECTHAAILSTETKKTVLDLLSESRHEIIVIPDLCGMAAQNKAELQSLTDTGKILIAACYPRAVKNLLLAAGVDTNGKSIDYINMRTQPADEIEKVTAALEKGNGTGEIKTVEKDNDWIPWFPVIDRDRCKDCRQCASFCLFGTYAVSNDGMVTVVNPQNCKNNCPACARICPEAAIIFPKLDESPINGDAIGDEEVLRGKIKLNVEEMLGDDLYEALARRRKKAKQLLLRKQSLEQAKEEREKCRAETIRQEDRTDS